MKRITFSAEERAIERARQAARSQGKTLSQACREWLESYGGYSWDAEGFDAIMRRFTHARAGRKFTRDEMNER